MCSEQFIVVIQKTMSPRKSEKDVLERAEAVVRR